MAETDNAVWRCLHCPTKIYGTGVKEQKEKLQAMIDEHMETHNNQPEQLNYVDSRTPEQRERDSRLIPVVTTSHPEYFDEPLIVEGSEQLNTQEWEKSIDSILAAMYLMGRQAERANRGDMSAIDTEALNQNNLQKTRIFNTEIQSLISKAVSKEQSRIIEICCEDCKKLINYKHEME